MWILLDVDGVCADFTSRVRDLVESIGGVMPEPTGWDFIKALPKVDRECVTEHMAQADFWLSLEEMPGAALAVNTFQAHGYPVVFCTAPWAGCREWAWARTKWLHKHFHADEHNVVITHSKELVGGAVFIDDKPLNVHRWKAEHRQGDAWLWDTTYNQGDPVQRMVGGWTGENIHRILEAMEAHKRLRPRWLRAR